MLQAIWLVDSSPTRPSITLPHNAQCKMAEYSSAQCLRFSEQKAALLLYARPNFLVYVHKYNCATHVVHFSDCRESLMCIIVKIMQFSLLDTHDVSSQVARGQCVRSEIPWIQFEHSKRFQPLKHECMGGGMDLEFKNWNFINDIVPILM